MMKYKKIVGGKRGLGKWHSLWLGEDHLLAVASTGYSEDYTRYYLKDIAALVTSRTAAGKLYNVLIGSALTVALLLCAPGYGKNGLSPGGAVAFFCALFFLLLLIWNLWRGPTCRCQLQTQVGCKEIPALDRVKKVKKALDRLSPLICLAQGEMSREDIVRLAATAKAFPGAASAQWGPGFAGTPPAVGDEIASVYRGGLHRAAFLALIADAALTLLHALHHTKLLVTLSFVTTYVFLILAIVALLKYGNYKLPSLVKELTWGGVVTTVAGSAIGLFFALFSSLDKMGKFKGRLANNLDLLDMYAGIQPSEHRFFFLFLVVYAVVASLIGVSALALLGNGRTIVARRQA